jgi:polysaccharide transporter, PST family
LDHVDPLSVAEPAQAAAEPRGGLARNAFFLLLGQVGSTVLSIVLSAALGRSLGAADFGVYFLLVTMSTFAYVVVEWGQNTYLLREAARRPEAAGALLGSALAFRGLAAGAATLLSALWARMLGYDATIQALSALIVLCALPLALSQPYTCLFRAKDRMDFDAVITVAAKAATVAATLLLLWFGGHLTSVIAAQGLGGGLALATAVYLARRLRLARPYVSRESLRELASGGTPIAVFFVAMAVEPYLASIVLSKLAPAVVVGWYGAARNILGVLLAPATILVAAAFPRFCRSASRPAELRLDIQTTIRPLLWLAALGAVGTYLFAGFAVSTIYGPGRFAPAVGVLQVYAPAFLIFYLDMLLATVVTALGKMKELAVAKLASVGVSITLALVLVPLCQQRFGNGGLGLAVAFGLSELVMLGGCWYQLPRGALGRDVLLDLGRALLAGAGILAIFSLLPPVSPWASLPGSVLGYAALSLGLGLIRKADLVRLRASVFAR